MQISGAEVLASLTLIGMNTFDKLWDAQEAPNLQSTISKLWTYTGEKIEVLGIANVIVSLYERNQELQLLVINGDGSSLLGCD